MISYNVDIVRHLSVDEFMGMNPNDVIPLIEGDPYISTVPLEPGFTNPSNQKDGKRLIGLNGENTEINEGLIRFDIIFYVRMTDGLSQIIINVDYSDFRVIPINSFFRLYLKPFKTVYRNKFLIAS